MKYGVFFVKNNTWVLWGMYVTLSNAQQEASYLATYLGINAKVFIK